MLAVHAATALSILTTQPGMPETGSEKTYKTVCLTNKAQQVQEHVEHAPAQAQETSTYAQH
jgi:hypothetical protein